MRRHKEADTSIQEYCDEMVPPGERAWFIQLTGHTMVAFKTKTFKAIHAKLFEKVETIRTWEGFKFGMAPEPDNSYDEEAVEVFLWRSAKGVMTKRPLGYVAAKDSTSKKMIRHNRGIKEFIEADLVIKEMRPNGAGGHFETPKVRLVHIWWDNQRNYGAAWFAIHTKSAITGVARGVSPITNFSPDDEVEEKKPIPRNTKGAQPVSNVEDYPAPIIIDKLITAHQEFAEMFRLVEDNGTCEPCFLSELEILPKSYDSQVEFDKDSIYGRAMETKSLNLLHQDYGPIYTRNYYKLSGIYEGPFTSSHVSSVLASINEALAIFRRYRSPIGK